ncbi:hypothetical protein PJX95_12150 [Serratia rubidaea]|uniref:hypothetical protein n=2 Tax=Serratia rubidaea TaxID=61652 RepID=UPI00234B1732|nr:hypothetical protein [Serratia rubidaea]MDC6118806.1 hypothetical protein [Serratia rubidaea]MEB7587055.1 hypothetical protein [Serratia rubidaea]
MNSRNYQAIKKDIRLYANDMNQWWKSLQKESVAEWTLLTTFGCWGIPNHVFQITAFILTILLFSGKLLKIKHKHSFSETESSIVNKIKESNITPSEKDALNFRLDKVRGFRKNRNTLFVIKRNWRFLSSYLYLMISFLYILFL